MVQSFISLNDNFRKLVREAQQLTSEEEKQDWKFNNYWFDKKKSSGLDQITNQSFWRL